MKVKKLAQGLILSSLTGAVTLMGTPIAFGAECSALSPCVVKSVPSVVSPAPAVPSVTSPVAPVVDSAPNTVATAAAGTIEKSTAPITDTVNSEVTPIVPVPSVLHEPIPAIPPAPSTPVEQLTAPVEPVTISADKTNTEVVSPPDTKSALVTTPVAESHDSSAVFAGALDGTTTLTPNLLNFQPAAVHSSQGSITKVIDSGAFGFGYINPVDSPTFTGLVFAYIIVLGSAVGIAVKRSVFPNFRKLRNVR